MSAPLVVKVAISDVDLESCQEADSIGRRIRVFYNDTPGKFEIPGLLLPLSPSGEPTPELVELVARALWADSHGGVEQEFDTSYFHELRAEHLATARAILSSLCASAQENPDK